MCTVFAESEVISLIGRGEPRENIARGVIDSVVSRVATMAGQAAGAPYYLTGGLCENAYVVERLGELLGSPVTTSPQARFAGAIGAAIRAQALNVRGGVIRRPLSAPPCVYWEELIDRREEESMADDQLLSSRLMTAASG